MPRNTDPSQITVGAGRAGQGSVDSSSLTFTPGGGAALQPDVLAEDVESVEPPLLGGENVQVNLNVINDLAPLPRPNRLDETQNPLNLPGLAYNPTPALGRYPDGTATGAVARLVNVQDLEISGILYPADRGVLAVKLDGTVVQAIILRNLFTEGDPEASASPARIIGQADVPVAPASAAIDGLPVDITLSDRLPQLTDYTRANFPFLGAGPDPVYDAFAVDYAGYQLARFVITVDLGLTSGLRGIIELVHYKTAEDYFADKAAQPYEAFADFQLFAEPLYRDADVATGVTINSYTFTPVDDADTAEATPRVMSGVTYYGPADDFELTTDVDGLYADTFLEDALRLRYNNGSNEGAQSPLYTDYSPNPILTGSTATAAALTLQFEPDDGELALIGSPELLGTDPFNRQDIEVNSDARNILGNAAVTFQFPGDIPPVSRIQTENFIDEVTRYAGADLATVQPDPRGVNSTFDPEVFGASDLQVRGIVSGHTIPAGVSGLGGELAYPDTNYSVNHVPNLPGGVAQPNYSGLTGTRSYLRAFGLTKPTRDFQLRVIGNPTAGAADLSEDLLAVGRTGVSSSGVALAFFNGLSTLTVGLSTELGGAMLAYEVESTQSVLFTLRMATFPLYNSASGYYAYYFAVSIQDGSTAATGGDFAIYKIELIEG